VIHSPVVSVVIAVPLVLGLALALLAGRRGWAPPLWVALATGAALRLLIVALAATDTWQPWDFSWHFLITANDVTAGRDPILHIGETGWHFLPTMAYVLGGQRALGLWLGVPWEVIGRLVPVLADLGLIPLVGALARERQALRRFQYACVPTALMVSALHAQITSVALLFIVAALLAVRAGRPAVAGGLLGMAVSVGNWPVLLLPAVLLGLAGLRARLVALAWTGAVPAAWFLSAPVFMDSTLADLPGMARGALSTRPLIGEWGWTVVLTGGDLDDRPGVARVGSLVLLTAVAAAVYWWRRADPVDVTLAVMLAFLVVTYRFGPQYLLWAVPLLIARPTRFAWTAIVTSGAWAAAGYLLLSRLDEVGWWHAHMWWALASLVVVPWLAYALPWERRDGRIDPRDPAAPPESARATAAV
jgi:hypothetical protein